MALALGRLLEHDERVAEVDWTDAATRHIDALLFSERLSYLLEQMRDGLLSLWFDVSSAHQ
jgi:hypothetical protein